MGELKKLFQVKRILAMVLAVTLAVTSAPVTAQAAPGEDPEQIETTVEDNTTGEKEGEPEGGSAAANKDADAETPETTPTDADTETPEPTETPVEIAKDAETVPADQAQEQQPAAEAASEVQKAEIKIGDFSNLGTGTVSVDWDYENQSATVTTDYSDENDNPFKSLVEGLGTYVSFDGIDDPTESGALKAQLKYTWQQKGGDGNYAPMAGASAPVNAGEYRLEISIDQELVAAEAKYIDFIINKAKLYIVATDAENGSFNGKTVGEVQEAYFKALQIGLVTSDGTEDVQDRYLQFVTAADKSVVKVSDPLGEALADTVILKKGSDYLVEIAPALKPEYQANYELQQYANTIVITDAALVRLETESALEPGKDITYVYGDAKNPVKSPIAADAAADKKVTVKIIVDGEKDAATGKEKELPVVLEGDKKNITGAWLDVDKKALEEETVPEDAGIYYYKLTYTDPDGIYGVAPNAECLVKVVVEPAKLAVRPVIADDKKEYQKGTAVSQLLKNVGYELYEKDDAGAYAKKYEISSEEKDTFWGVSYNQPNKPQYYEPVFKVQMRTTTTTTYTDTTKKAETVEDKWADVTAQTLTEKSGKTVIKEQSDKDKTVEKNVEYRVVFAGKKGLYKDGNVDTASIVEINKQIDVNSANKNYDVDVAKAVVEDAANVVAITVNDSTEVTINTDDIKANIKDMELKDGVYTKEYNEKAPFADRSEYKKAKTDKAEADAAGSFTYEWYGYTLVDKLDDKGEVVKDAAGNPVKEPVCDGNSVNTQNDYTLLNTLANAGQYCLKISYIDKTKTYTAKPAYLFFEVKGKLLKVVPNPEQKPKAYTGQETTDFLKEIEKTFAYSIYEKDEKGTNLTETLKQLDQEINEADKTKHLYKIDWIVLAGDNTDPAKAKYAPYIGSFKEGVSYKLGASLSFKSNVAQKYLKYYKNYTNRYERAETDPIQDNYWYTPLDIEVGVMSDVGLKIDFHPEKITEFEKIYNGEEQFKVEDLIAAGYITAVKETEPDIALAIGSGEGQVPLVFKWKYKKEYSWTDLGEEYANPVNAGEYRLIVSYPGDDKYRSVSKTDEGTFGIKPRDLKIQAKAALENGEITAGWDMSEGTVRNRLIDKDNLKVTGYIEADKEAFAGDDSGTGLVKDAPAFKDRYGVEVWEKGQKDQYYGYLRYDREYEAGVWASIDSTIAKKVLKDKDADNYNIIVECAAFKVGKRGNSTVKDVEKPHADDVSDNSESVATHVRAAVEDNKVTVTPASGICYLYNNSLSIPNEKFVPGNYLIFTIVAPKEFDANGRVDTDGGNWTENTGDYSAAFPNFVYKNSIEGAGKGFVLEEDEDEGTITVAFPVTKEDKKTARNFTILWEKLNGVNYAEEYTVDMSNAQLEDDLRTAVAPKTLAFNGVNTKMTVGETQQLDVKMTKVLNSDVVFLNYKVAAGSEKFASVTTETGVVTALSKGKATIEVYPVRRNGKGEVEKVPDFNKTITTTINISDVTAPKINSVYAYDDYFELKYTQPADGYRREIYVLEGKNKKYTEFETLIKDAQDNGKNKLDEAFVYAEYVTIESEHPDSKKVVTMPDIGGIEPGKEYTVYVRNVSGVRTLDDGSLVVASAAGNVKSFKATKVQLEGIRLDYKDAEEQAKTTPDKEKLYPNSSIDEIDLSKGSVQLKAMGAFKMQPETSDADGTDYEFKELPISKTDANYEAQKLSFYAVDSTGYYTKEDVAKYKLKDYKTVIGDRCYIPSSIAKIDNKGKLTLKGVGVVYIIAYDSVSKKITPVSGYTTNIDGSLEVSKVSHYALRITSPITKITAKNVTLKVGSHASVRPSITFFNDKKKLAVKANDTNIGLVVKNADDSKAVEVVHGDYIVAKEPNAQVKLTVCLRDNPKVETTLTVNTKPMDSVKAVKAVDVIDDEATITFTHTGNEVNDYYYYNNNYYPYYYGEEPVKFKIDLLDNRNRLISSHIEAICPVWNKSDTKKGVYFYQYTLGGLKRQSIYNVLVSPIYGEQTAKETKGKFTTTNIPAAGNTSVGKADDGTLYEGGITIRIESANGRYSSDWNGSGWSNLQEAGYLTSGNTYTLIADADSTAKARMTDTLTWKSSNSKVASVKANTGTYTATLKASSVGYTYIEVTSKITKKVIARYIVRVKSVSNGGQGAYGDTEPKYNVAWDPNYDQGIEVLTEKNPVSFATPMGSYDYRWISFTAPADGYYSLNRTNVSISGYYYKTDFPEEYDGGKKEEFVVNSYANATLNEGDTIYFKATGTTKKATAVVSVGYVTKYGKLTASGSVSAADFGQVTFTAPEDNYYTFYATESGKSASYTVKESGGAYGTVHFATEAAEATDAAGIGLKKGQSVALYGIASGNYSISVKGRTYEAPGTGTGELAADGKEGSVAGKWYAYKAPAAGEYTFTISPNKAGAMGAYYYTNLTSGENSYNDTFTVNTVDGKETLSCEKSLNEGDKIAIYVYAKSAEKVSADVSVSQPKTAEVSLTTPTGELEVKSDAPVWVSFKVPETGKEYCFNYAVETGKSVDREYYKNNVESASTYLGSDRFTSSRDDKTIYIKLTTNDASAKVTVSVKKTEAEAIAPGADVSFDVTSGNMQFYTFTAPATGLYRFEATLAEASKGKNVSVVGAYRESQNTGTFPLENNRVNGVKKMLAGQKLTLAVKTIENDAVKGNLKVTAVPFETLEAKEYTLAANEIKWFKFTPGAAGKYDISYSTTAVIVSYGAALDDITTNMPVLYHGDYAAGDVVYVKAVNTNAAAESKITFTISAMDQPLPADGKITVKAGSPATYKYVVKQTGRYKVTWTSDPADAGATVNYSQTRMTSGDEIVCDTKGETITFTVNTVKDAVVTLNMAPIVPSTTLEATVAKGGGVQWFAYTAPATGRYTVAMTDDAGKAVAEGVTAVCTYGEITNEFDFDNSLDGSWPHWINKGEVWYFRVTNSAAADQKVKIAVTPVTASEELKVGEDPKTVAIGAGEVKWYKLALDEDVPYNFTVENADVELFPDWYGKDDFDDYAYEINESEVIDYCDKGTYLVRVQRPEGTAEANATKIGVKKEPVLTLKEGEDLSISLENGVTQYIKFTPSKTAYYALRLKEVPEDVTSVNVNGCINLTKSETYGYTSMTMAEPETFTAWLNFTPAAEGEKKTVKLSVEEIKPAELVSELSVTVEKGAKSWFTFTAPEDGFYNFAEDSKDVQVKYSYTDNYPNELPGNASYEFPYKGVYLNKGQKLAFCVFYNELKAGSTAEKVPDSATFKVTAAKMQAEELILDTQKEITFSENETEKWYSVKPEEDGYYWFSFKGTEGLISVTVFENGASKYNWNNLSLAREEIGSVKINTTNKYFIRITSQNSTTPAFQMRVFNKPSYVDISVGDEETPAAYVSVAEGETVKYKFTPTESGQYTFYTDMANMDTYGTLYDEKGNQMAFDDDNGNGRNFKISSTDLKSGQTYYLGVRCYSSNTSMMNCPLYVVKEPAVQE